MVSAKFYMSLTLPTPNRRADKVKMYESINRLPMLDTRFQPKILNNEFFSGLDKLFHEHLLPSFQMFANSKWAKVVYDLNKVPSLEDSDAETDTEMPQKEEEKEIVNICWTQQFQKQYVPAVREFVKKWVEGQIKDMEGKIEEIEVLKNLEKQVDGWVTMGDDATGIPSVMWHMDRIGVPLVTPIFVRMLMKELNQVEEAAIAVRSDPQVSQNLLISKKRYSHSLSQWHG